ncbi:hypothetical protein ANN_08256 [Periplaneta americana]|uniref:Uncharacterized protein n=1 Tax=Periplaneta americana TaxID=6978 RepID=A0ABQ8T225_PERAM|nr:hypothetical protein ANN_08256 [Periplaneta americana]
MLPNKQLGINNVRCYVWTENKRSRESSEISSAIYDSLQKVDSAKIRKIRLFSDSCTGQNENMNMVSMAATWLVSKSLENITEMELHFPVTGHSFLPEIECLVS